MAKEILRRHHDAEDVSQDVWVKYLGSDPNRVREPRKWWRVVTRHIALRLVESQRKRRQREQVYFDRTQEALEAPQRETDLKRIVRSLKDPYTTVLLMRYFDDCSVEEIARSLGRSRGTVRSQIKRGLDLLRMELGVGKGAGKKSFWFAGLLPALVWPSLRPRTRTWMLISGLAASGFVLGIGAPFLLGSFEGDNSLAQPAIRAAFEPTPSVRMVAGVPGPEGAARTLAPTELQEDPAGSSHAAVAAPLGESFLLEGQVLVSREQKPTTAEIWCQPLAGEEPRQLTDADSNGRFRIELPEPCLVWAVHDDYLPSWRLEVTGRSSQRVQHTFDLIPPSTRLSGRVLDHSGAPMAHVDLELTYLLEPRTAVSGLRDLAPPVIRASSDSSGRYQIPCPKTNRQSLAVLRDGVVLMTRRYPFQEGGGVGKKDRLPSGGRAHLMDLRVHEPSTIAVTVPEPAGPYERMGAKLFLENLPPVSTELPGPGFFPLPIQASGRFVLVVTTDRPATGSIVQEGVVKDGEYVHLAELSWRTDRTAVIRFPVAMGAVGAVEPWRVQVVTGKERIGPEAAVVWDGDSCFVGPLFGAADLFFFSSELAEVPSLVLRGVKPGALHEVELASPVQSGGRVFGKLARAAEGWFEIAGPLLPGPIRLTGDGEGRFEVSNLLHGDYKLLYRSAELGQTEVAAFEHRLPETELPSLKPPSYGSLVLDWDRPLTSERSLHLSLIGADRHRVWKYSQHVTDQGLVEGQRQLVVPRLFPGTYDLVVYGGFRHAVHSVTVEADKQAQLSLDLELATGVRFFVEAERPLADQESLAVWIHSAEGRRRAYPLNPIHGNDPQEMLVLRMGVGPTDRRVVIETSGGLRGAAEILAQRDHRLMLRE